MRYKTAVSILHQKKYLIKIFSVLFKKFFGNTFDAESIFQFVKHNACRIIFKNLEKLLKCRYRCCRINIFRLQYHKFFLTVQADFFQILSEILPERAFCDKRLIFSKSNLSLSLISRIFYLEFYGNFLQFVSNIPEFLFQM